jgi:hypothetical protein
LVSSCVFRHAGSQGSMAPTAGMFILHGPKAGHTMLPILDSIQSSIPLKTASPCQTWPGRQVGARSEPPINLLDHKL